MKQLKLLELFSGTGSVGKVAKLLGYDVVSLDIKNADITSDILTWDYKQYEVEHFDVIHASPPCTEYSIAKTVGERDLETANEIVLKTLEIIEYLNPKYYIIENPQTGLLKNQWFMYGIPYQDIDYCKYGFPYRKRTRIWTNITTWTPQPLCIGDCGNTEKGNNNRYRHLASAQRGPTKCAPANKFKQDELYRIPAVLIREIFESI